MKKKIPLQPYMNRKFFLVARKADAAQRRTTTIIGDSQDYTFAPHRKPHLHPVLLLHNLCCSYLEDIDDLCQQFTSAIAGPIFGD